VDVRGINHIVLKVRNLEASDKFYREALGLTKIGARGRMWFYTAGAHHHDLALFEVRRSSVPGAAESSLFHFCLDVADETALVRVYRRCLEAGVAILGTVDHNISRSFYARDPDGNVVELTYDVPREQWANLTDPFAEDLPYELPV
jgi:catechol 2,3-dioxygenase